MKQDGFSRTISLGNGRKSRDGSLARLRHNFLEHAALLCPTRFLNYLPQNPLTHFIPPTDSWLQEKEPLLVIGRQIQEGHDLANAGARDAPETRKIRKIFHGAIPEQLFEPNRQRHEPGYPRQPANSFAFWFLPIALRRKRKNNRSFRFRGHAPIPLSRNVIET